MRRITLLPLFLIQDSTSFYRGMGALAALKKTMPELELMFASESRLGWVSAGMADVLFMQRPFNGRDVRTIKDARRAGLPVWIDYDDDLMNIGDDNMTAAMYQRPELQRAFLMCLELADHVSFSTPALAARYGGQTRAHSIIPNAFPDSVVRGRARDAVVKRPEGKEDILWRGSMTHKKDVDLVAPQLVDIMVKHHEKFSLNMLGDRHWRVSEPLAEQEIMVNYHDGIPDVLDYYEAIREMNPRVMISPLANTPLNRAKSNIAWIEATYAGALTVAPNWPEWDRPGVVRYDETKPESSFHTALEHVLAMDKFQVESMNLEAWKYVYKNRLSVVNEKRRHLVETLAEQR